MVKDTKIHREILSDEAAAWVVRLSDPGCSDADRAAFEGWRSLSLDHEVAFEREAAAWESLSRLQALNPGGSPDPDLLAPDWPDRISETGRRQRAPRRYFGAEHFHRRAAFWAAGIIMAGTAIGLGAGIGADPAYATAVGERRLVVLEDGSRVELNTDSKIKVRYRKDRREVQLLRGEALFQIASGARPFVVTAETAVLTSTKSEVSVRLRTDGASVAVRQGTISADPDGPDTGEPSTRIMAGQGGTFRSDGVTTRNMEEEEIARLMAWRQGSIALDGQRLEDAAAEFNRYNINKIMISDRSIADYKLGGYFKTDDLKGFVGALRSTFPVSVQQDSKGNFRISRKI